MWWTDCAYTQLAAGLLLTPLAQECWPTIPSESVWEARDHYKRHSPPTTWQSALNVVYGMCDERASVKSLPRDEWSQALQLPILLTTDTWAQFINNHNFFSGFFSPHSLWGALNLREVVL